MTARPPGWLRTCWLLAALALRRMFNRMTWQMSRLRRKSAQRRGTGRKIGAGAVIVLLFAPMFVIQAAAMSGMLIRRLVEAAEQPHGAAPVTLRVNEHNYRALSDAQRELDRWQPPHDDDPLANAAARDRFIEQQVEPLRNELVPQDRGTWEFDQRSGVRLTDAGHAFRDEVIEQYRARGLEGFRAPGHPVLDEIAWPEVDPAEPAFLRGMASMLLVVVLAVFLMMVGSGGQDLGRVAWSYEWLFSFPVATRSLVVARLLEYTVVAPAVWLTLLPMLALLGVSAGLEVGALIALALAGTLLISLGLAAGRLLLESWLRAALPLDRLKNLQATALLLATALMFIAMYVAVGPGAPGWLRAIMVGPFDALLYLPTSLPLIAMRGGQIAWAPMLALAGITLGAIALGVIGTTRSLRDGIIVMASPYVGRRAVGGPQGVADRRALGVVAKELRLLLRDRAFMVQTLVVPLFLILLQLLLNPSLLAAVSGDFRHAAAMSFGVGAYVLAFGGMASLSSEGKAVWLLFTLPCPLHVMLRRKVLVWGAVAMAYALAVQIYIATHATIAVAELLPSGLVALVGVAIFASIAGGMGVLGWTPDLIGSAQRVRVGTAYAYLFLASNFAYGIYAGGVWARLVVLMLSIVLAAAIWEKVRDQLPVLLDPTAPAPAAVALADGAVALYCFFVLQGLLSLVLPALRRQHGQPSWMDVTLSFCGAGAIVLLASWFVLHRRGVVDLAGRFGMRRTAARCSAGRALILGISLGALCGAIGLWYVRLVRHWPPLSGLRDALPENVEMGVEARLGLIVLAVIAAPVIEEFLFRGLLYQGLRRSLRPAAAVLACAALFAIVHPPASVPPVFVMGVAAALAREWTGLLPASIAVHFTYNAIVVIGSCGGLLAPFSCGGL